MATAKKTTSGGAKAPVKKASAPKTAAAAKKSPAKPPVASKKASAPASKTPAKKAAPVPKKPVAPASKKPAPTPKKPVPAPKKAVAPAAKKVAAPVAKKAAPAPAAKAPAKKAVAPAKKAAAPAKKAAAPSRGRLGRLPLPPPPPPPNRGGAVKQNPLTKEQIKGFRARLAVELEFIKGNLNALTRDALRQQSESAGDVGVHSTHMADHGTDNFDRDINLLLASGRQEAIYAIEDALRRMDAGSFGVCEVCGNPIGFDRLDAMPYAKMCIECKKDLEKGKGRPTFRPYSRETSLQASQDGGDREPVEGGDNPGDAGGGAE